MSNKLIVILGPTASGKTNLSIKLAKKFKGEIVSADSRQVYKGMNIGSGKITKKEMRGIPHYGLDIASPKRKFNVSRYKKFTLKTIKSVWEKNKIPFLVGGSGFYIQAVIDDLKFPEIKPDWKLRKKLEKKPNKELFEMLEKTDPQRAETIDKNNPRRLIRALEIAINGKNPVPPLKKSSLGAGILILGIKKNKKELKKLISQRLIKRLNKGMISEVKKLNRQGLSWKRLEEFGLEYRYIAYYIQKKIGYKEMTEKLQKEIEHFAKRQMTWFKRDPRIKWVKNSSQAENFVKKFLISVF